MKLSDTQRAILEAAAAHPEHLAYPPERLPAGALQKIADALLRRDLVIALPARAYAAAEAWQVDGVPHLLQITDEGLRAIGIDPNAPRRAAEDEQSAAAIARRNAERRAAEAAATGKPTAPTGGAEDGPQGQDAPAPEAAQGAPAAPAGGDDATPARSRRGAREVLAEVERAAMLDGAPVGFALLPIETLALVRSTLAAPTTPRPETKHAAVLTLLRRPEGATGPQIAEATGWAPHTVRGFLAGLRKKGIEVTILDRVRSVGPNKQGGRGSFTVYAIAG